MKPISPKATIKEVLETVIDEIVEKGIYWKDAQAQFEKLFILRVLRGNGGSMCHAAKTMGLHRNTLTKKIRVHSINKRKLRG